MTHEEWTPEEAERLRAARVDGAPPRRLQEDTVSALRERGLLKPPRRGMMAVMGLAAMAAALVIAVGWGVTRRSALGPAVPASPRFVLLLYAGTDPVAGTPDTRRGEYSQWARDVAAGGTAISGEELSDEAREVPPAGAAAAAGPLPRGFFVVSAPDLDAAQRIAATCPHLRHGGRIVIKRIVS